MKRALFFVALLLASCRNDPVIIEPGGLDFGEVDATSISPQSRFVRLTNPSSGDRVCVIEPLGSPFATLQEGEVVVKGLSAQTISVTFLPRDGLEHRGKLELHSSDGGCEGSVELRGLGSGRLAAVPSSLEFKLNPGQAATQKISLQNGRRTPVRFQLSVESFSNALSVTRTADTIPPGGAITLTVRAAQTRWNQLTDAVVIFEEKEQLRIPVTVTPASPTLEVTPLAIDVPVAAVGDFVDRTFRITNTGASGDNNAPKLGFMGLPRVALGNPEEVEFFFSSQPLLAEGESFDLTMRVRFVSEGPRTFQVGLPALPEFVARSPLTLTAEAKSLQPCTMQVDPRVSLHLQDAGDGGVVGRVSFTNSGSTLCVVDNLRLQSSPLSMISGGAAQVQVPAGSSHQVTIAGPNSPDAGTFRFHILNMNGLDESIELLPP